MKPHEDFTSYSKLADVGRWYVTEFVKQVAQVLPKGCMLLDAGAGECVYSRFFPECHYVGVDCAVGEPGWNYRNLDCVATLQQLPFANESFHAVLSTQTLEHLELPMESLREMHRVLKPDGTLFLTAPMAHAEHQKPHDYFRYTSFGLKCLCRRVGFSDVLVAPFGGMFVRWAYELPLILTLFPTSGPADHRHLAPIAALPLKALTLLVVRTIQVILLQIDRLDRVKEFPLGWSLVARKRT
jgi:SAM-dependent methyltransferase